ncbi:MAG TPA: nitroreductase family protein [Fibrobacteria bacterium]|nr:nitroreductase family protein [Fibrobacteria bacterium]
MTGEDFLSLCRARRSSRDFLPVPLEAGQVEVLLECAKSIPYASSRKGWDVVAVVDPLRIEEAAQAVDRAASEWAGRIRADLRSDWDAYSRNFSSFRGAPVVFATVFRPSPGLSAMLEESHPWADRFDRENHLKSISNATMALCLAATAMGLAACPMTGPLLAREDLERILQLPRGRELAAFVAVGVPAAADQPSNGEP